MPAAFFVIVLPVIGEKCVNLGLVMPKSGSSLHIFVASLRLGFVCTMLICSGVCAGAVAHASSDASKFESDTLLSLPQVSVTAIKGGALANHDEAVTTVGHAELERLNVVNIKQLSEIAPNFYMPAYGTRMTSSVYVRGLGTRIDQPSVGLNIDNVPMVNKDNFDFDVADIARIEILRGPQNILYGRNTMGGLINIHTLSPFNFEGLKLTAEYGSHGSYKASAGLYKRMNARHGTSLNLYATGTDGAFRNECNGARVGRERTYSARWKTIWRTSQNSIVENTLSASHSAQSGYPYENVETGRLAYNDTCFYRRLTLTDGLVAKMRFGRVDLSAIGSFQYINDNMTIDQDFLPLDYFTLTQKRHEWAVTADVVARSTAGRHYSWLAGVFGFGRRGNMSAPVTFHDYGLTHLVENNANLLSPEYPVRWDSRSLLLGSDFLSPSGGFSLYHESKWVQDSWTFTLGLRWDWEHSSLIYRSRSNSTYSIYHLLSDGAHTVYRPHVPVDIDDRGHLSQSFNQLLPKLSVSYELPSGMGNVFASVGKGYKSGGYNTQMFSDVLQQRIRGMLGLAENYTVHDIVSYKPEKTWNYEVGAHLALFNRRLMLDLAAFWIECRDQQLTMFPEGSVTGRVMANAGKSRSIGTEISAVAEVGGGFRLRLSHGFTDATFRHFSNGKSDWSGCHVPYAPANTLYAGITYDRGFSSRAWLDHISVNAGCRGIGRIYWDEANSVAQPFYALLDASVRMEKGGFSVDVWAENISDTHYSTFYFVSIGNSFLQRGAPFACGATLRYSFSFEK